MREIARLRCIWARLNIALGEVKKQADPELRKKLAREKVLPIRKELVKSSAEVHRLLLSIVTTTGGLGTVANWQQHILPGLLLEPGKELAGLLGGDLPEDAAPARIYEGEPRVFVPTVRTSIEPGEQLKLKVILLGAEPGELAVYYRPMGRGEFERLSLEHLNRGVYTAAIPPAATGDDLEYYVQVTSSDRAVFRFPPTAPELNQTVVSLPAR